MYKKTTTIFATIILISMIFLMPQLVSGKSSGYIEMIITSPLGSILFDGSIDYNTGKNSMPLPDTKIIRTEFDNFEGKYTTDGTEFSQTPYCREGGRYTMDVKDSNPFGTHTSNDITLYYCKTTKDLLDMITIPDTWDEDELLIYCNDGNQINYRSNNFEIFTNRLNAYKVCILKNLNMTENNTVIYGFEVGNNIIDDRGDQLFNHTTNSSPITLNLEYVGGDSPQTKTYKYLTYKSVEKTGYDENSYTRYTYTETTAVTKSITGIDQYYNEYVDTNNNNKSYQLSYDGITTFFTLKDKSNTLAKVDIPDYSEVLNLPIRWHTKYSDYDNPVKTGYWKIPENYKAYSNGYLEHIRNFEQPGETVVPARCGPISTERWRSYTYPETCEYTTDIFGSYDEMISWIQAQYTGTGSAPLSYVFNYPTLNNIDTTRVALFRSLSGGRKVYGYETPLSLEISNIGASGDNRNSGTRQIADFGRRVRTVYTSRHRSPGFHGGTARFRAAHGTRRAGPPPFFLR